MKKTYLAITIIFFGLSCRPEQKPIQYGHDKCAYCTMSIVDQRFGGELVTTKGKIFMFDAVECMINHIHEKKVQDEDISFLLTNTFDQPSKLLDVKKCFFLQSSNMPSPMGMYINPVSDFETATDLHKNNGGEIYQWNALMNKMVVD